MSIKASFADLTHTGQVVAANTFPFGISLVAAHVKQTLADGVEVELFKYPNDFSGYLNREIPRVAAFSCYLWNVRLAYAYAERIKRQKPETVVVFGGPNYPIGEHEQREFLRAHPAIDFYVWKEGEKAAAQLYRRLAELDYDAERLKASGELLGSVHYLKDGNIVRGPILPRMESLTEAPSPYALGLHDKFFDGVLIPMIETNRGCPFSCAFCIEGNRYYNKVRWDSLERIRADLHYIADRTTQPDLLITDSNFGMYKDDLETCRMIAELQKTRGWPRYVQNSSGKNQKERVLEAARILNGAMILTVSIQSADEVVLRNIKRDNISLDQIVAVGKEAEKVGANSYSEIILGLPGDSRASHFNSVKSMIDADINDTLTYQTMMLPGTEIATPESRMTHGMVTKFRALPRCFGVYELFGERMAVSEIEEICVANATLSYNDYLSCRELSLSVELFHNSGAFYELAELLKQHGIKRSEFLQAAHDRAVSQASPIADLYAGYMEENQRKLWDRKHDLEAFLAEPGVIERHISGELGSSELYKYRAMAFFWRQEDLHEIAFGAARGLLEGQRLLDARTKHYLKELRRFSLARKAHLHETDRGVAERFAFDFTRLQRSMFKGDPFAQEVAGGVAIRIDHTREQREMIAAYLKQYGSSVDGLGRLLLRSHVNKLYRVGELAQAEPLAVERPAELHAVD